MDRCQVCGQPLDVHHRADQVYCSRTCRNRAWRRRRSEAIPRPVPVTVAPAAPAEPLPELDAVLERVLDESRLLAHVARAASRDTPNGWRAAAWLLERRYPQRWAPPLRTAPLAAPEDNPEVEAQVQRLLSLVPNDAG